MFCVSKFKLLIYWPLWIIWEQTSDINGDNWEFRVKGSDKTFAGLSTWRANMSREIIVSCCWTYMVWLCVCVCLCYGESAIRGYCWYQCCRLSPEVFWDQFESWELSIELPLGSHYITRTQTHPHKHMHARCWSASLFARPLLSYSPEAIPSPQSSPIISGTELCFVLWSGPRAELRLVSFIFLYIL